MSVVLPAQPGPSSIDSADYKQVFVGGKRFNVLDVGLGQPVLMLHGFPSSHRLWRKQVVPLLEAGFRVVAPDLRGFGDSARPEGVAEYRASRILGDVTGILDSLGIRRSHVVAHDWGAAIAWSFAALLPHRVHQLVAISVGHPETFKNVSLQQRQQSWYMLLYQFPEAEQLLRRGNWQLLRELYQGEEDAAQFLKDLARPGALTAGLNWYRANRHPATELVQGPRVPSVLAPTMGIWGSRDRALTEESMLASEQHVEGGWRYHRVEGAGHYLPVDAPEELAGLLLDFLDPTAETSQGRRHVRRRRY